MMIAAYTFNADIYCPPCVVKVLTDDARFDGWALADGLWEPAETQLDEIASAYGFDRMDESSFDSGDFPKVVFSHQIDEAEQCGRCGEDLS